MPSLNFNALLKQMLTAFYDQLSTDAVTMAKDDNITQAMATIVDRIIEINDMVHAKKISQQQAQSLLDMQKQDAEQQLLTIKGLTLIAIQNSINAALNVVKTAVNKAIGFALL